MEAFRRSLATAPMLVLWGKSDSEPKLLGQPLFADVSPIVSAKRDRSPRFAIAHRKEKPSFGGHAAGLNCRAATSWSLSGHERSVSERER
jgi:hypothetical protein